MSRRHLRRTGPGPLELIEEAVHLLRLAPWAVLGGYYLGSLPFVLGLLYFWTDMSRGSAAYKHCAPASFAVALLFLWMKTWQAIFARQLKEQIAGRSASVVALSGFVRTAINQTILQPSGLFLLPLSLLLLLPFGWLFAFYQSVNAFAAEDGAAAKHVFQRAARQAQLWPRQNHAMLGVLFFFGLVVFLDVAIGLATVPSLVKMLFGIENAFTRSPWGLLNSTFMATVGALTYLSLDPLVKAVYLLRCFYGESQHTGEDLRTELKQFVQSAGVAAMVLLPVVLTFAAMDEPRREAINYNYCARNGTLNWFESPSIALRAPSPPLGEKDGMRGFGSWKPFTTSWSRIGTKHRWRSPSPVLRTPSPPVGEYPFSVAAGVPPAVEPGILPGGFSCGLRRQFRVQSCQSGRQDAALYGSQDGCRYSREPTLNTYDGPRSVGGGFMRPRNCHEFVYSITPP